MKGQPRINIRARRTAKINGSETGTINNKLKTKDLPTAAFRPYETTKPEKKPQIEKRATRSSTALKQTTLAFTQTEEKEQKEDVTIEKLRGKVTTVETTESTSKTEEKETSTNVEEKETITIVKQKDTIAETEQKEEAIKEEETTVKRRASSTSLQRGKRKTRKTDIAETNTANNEQETVEETKEAKIPTIETTEETSNEEHVTVNDYEDTPSPPSSNFLEPLTPPTHTVAESSSSHSTAPFKTYLTSADKERIEYEKTTLIRLRRSLDIAMTDRRGRNLPCLYHKMESALRNSTSRSISLSHVCQIMYVAPKLYTMEAVEIRNFGGKATEDYLLDFGEGFAPTTGKELEKRAIMLENAVNKYFIDHPEFDAVIPQIKVPKMSNVVDKDKWVKEAELPAGIRRLFEAHEENRKAEEKKKEIKPTPSGTPSERMAALKARLAEKKKAQAEKDKAV